MLWPTRTLPNSDRRRWRSVCPPSLGSRAGSLSCPPELPGANDGRIDDNRPESRAPVERSEKVLRVSVEGVAERGAEIRPRQQVLVATVGFARLRRALDRARVEDPLDSQVHAPREALRGASFGRDQHAARD